MANQPSPTVEELQLRKRARRRLIGAVTLVALMVTVLPMVLDDEPKPVGQDIAINIPSQQAAEPRLPPAPQPVEQPAPRQPEAPAPEKPAAPEAPPPAVKPPPAKPLPTPAKKPEKAAEKPVEKPKAAEKPKVTEKPKEAKPPEPKASETPHAGTQHVVLLGAFQSEANAKQRQAKLKELGIKYYTEKVKSPAGDKIGVRAGPYADRQEAEHALAKLKAAGIQDGMVAEKK